MAPRLLLVLALTAVTVSGIAAGVAGETPDRLGVVTSLAGSPTLSRASLPNARPLAFRDEILAGDTIRTPGAGALVRVLVTGRAALLSVAARSVVRLAEDGGAIVVRVESGKVSVVAEGPAGASPRPARIDAGAVLATLRGAAAVAEVRDGTVTLSVLRGEVALVRRAGESGPPLILRALEAVRVVGDAFGPVEPLTVESAAMALGEFRLGPTAPRPGSDPAPDVVSRQVLEAEAEMQRQGLTLLPGGPTSPGASAPTASPGQLRATGGAPATASAVVVPQSSLPSTSGGPVRGMDVHPGAGTLPRSRQSP
jgi:hypothetical protein